MGRFSTIVVHGVARYMHLRISDYAKQNILDTSNCFICLSFSRQFLLLLLFGSRKPGELTKPGWWQNDEGFLIPPGLSAVNSAKLRFFTRGKACHKRGKNAQSGIQIGRKLTWKWPLKNALKKFDFSSIHHYSSRGNERLVRKDERWLQCCSLLVGILSIFPQWSSLFRRFAVTRR